MLICAVDGTSCPLYDPIVDSYVPIFDRRLPPTPPQSRTHLPIPRLKVQSILLALTSSSWLLIFYIACDRIVAFIAGTSKPRY